MTKITEKDNRNVSSTGKAIYFSEKIVYVGGLLIATLLVASFAPVFAYHYTGYRWQGSSVNLCYDQNGLSQLNLSWTSVQSELEQARSDWNNQPSFFTLNRVWTNCQGHWVTAANEGNNLKYGRTVITVNGYITDADTIINSYYQYSTVGRCTHPPATLDYLQRHEFGHWVAFGDVYDPAKTTVMWNGYDCNKWNSIKTDDSNELTNIYG